MSKEAMGMKKIKKGIWVVILIILLGIGIYVISRSANVAKVPENNNTNTASRVEAPEQKSGSSVKKNAAKLVIGDDYFITQLNDIYYNMDDYIGREIEIEGFPLSYEEYKFIGRYGPGCCSNDGYAYIEYEYNKELQLTDEKDWIRVIGIIKKGKYEGEDYIYIDAASVEKMEVRGIDTVSI